MDMVFLKKPINPDSVMVFLDMSQDTEAATNQMFNRILFAVTRNTMSLNGMS